MERLRNRMRSTLMAKVKLLRRKHWARQGPTSLRHFMISSIDCGNSRDLTELAKRLSGTKQSTIPRVEFPKCVNRRLELITRISPSFRRLNTSITKVLDLRE